MLTSEIASLYISPANLLKFTDALHCSDGSGEFVNFSGIGEAAAWMDHLKCKSSELANLTKDPYCRGLRLAAGNAIFFPWHLQKYAYNPMNQSLPLEAQLANQQNWWKPDTKKPSSYWTSAVTGITALSDISYSLSSVVTSPWSLGLYIRINLHVWGDMHQPLHTVNLYDSTTFKASDLGGNGIYINAAAWASLNAGCNAANLHAIWDAGGCAFPGSYVVANLTAKAVQLTLDVPPDAFISAGRLSPDWNNAAANWGINANDVGHFLLEMALDTRSYIDFIYQEYLSKAYPSREYAPSATYVAQVRNISKHQVALGGYRLSSWLNYHSRYLPAKPCATLTAKEVPLADIPRLLPELQAQRQWAFIGYFVLGIAVGLGVAGALIVAIRRDTKCARDALLRNW